MTDPTPSRAPEREQKPARRCIDCGLVELPDRYPFTTCEDCWDRKYPPKANFAFDFAKPPPAASVREDEVVVRREELAVVLASFWSGEDRAMAEKAARMLRVDLAQAETGVRHEQP